MRDNTQGLAYIVELSKVEEIEGKDRIVLVSNNVNTLKATLSKEDLSKDKLFVFFEADTLIPDNYKEDKESYNEKFKFLESTRKKNSHYYRIKARTMGPNIVSMGLLVPMNDLITDEDIYKSLKQKYEATGVMDLTQYFELQKYEPPVPQTSEYCLQSYNDLYHGEKSFKDIPCIGYPEALTNKSDEVNFFKLEKSEYESHLEDPCYATIKLDGTSVTFYIKDDTYYILGHNVMSTIPQLYHNTAYPTENVFDKMKRYEKDTGRKLLVCGEFIGPKIQGNPYKIETPWNPSDPCFYGFYCYKMVSYIDENDKYTMGYEELKSTCEKYGITMVPLAWPAPISLRNLLQCIADIKCQDSFEEVLAKIQKSAEGMIWTEDDYEKCDWGKESDEKSTFVHEGYVVTSVNGHADGSDHGGWSFKVKGQKYQTLHN